MVLCLFVGAEASFRTLAATALNLVPVALRCEYLDSPLCLDEVHPRFNWRLESGGRSQRQTAYQILVAQSESALQKEVGDLWDSGKVPANQTFHIVYQGKPLSSRMECFWKVRVWDQDGQSSSWSKPARWGVGLLSPDAWQSQFISYRDSSVLFKSNDELFLPPARQYRKEFIARKPIRRALVYSTALGIYEMHLNGRRIGDSYFAPGWCDYRQRAYYHADDVTGLIQAGTNALGAWVADGWYSGYLGFGLLEHMGTEHIGRYTYGKTPSFMAQLEIEYADGSRDTIVTDTSWKVTGSGPIQEADLLMGEFYDARKELADWCKAGFDDKAWEPAIRAEDNGPAKGNFYEFQNPAPGEAVQIKGKEIDLGFKRPPKLEAFPGVPVRAIQEIKPIAITSPTPNVHIFNLGQNFAGVVRLKIKGPAGLRVRLRYGEMLHPNGKLMTENLRKARATDFYVLRGEPAGEIYIPRFTFHGFQYVELTGYPQKPDPDTITGIVLHSDTPLTSDFECSDPMVNQLFKNIVWTQRANFLDLPTDCPQRDERFGWTGDAQVYVRTATYNADVSAFYTKWLRDLMESQRPSGTFPGYAPFPFQHGWDFGTAWCDAGVICPWTIYQVYGDKGLIDRCWEPMARFIKWRTSESKNFLGVTHGNEWGDWLALNEKTPIDYIDTAYYAYSVKLMADLAQGLGKTNAMAELQKLLSNIRLAFKQKYVKADGMLTIDTQTVYALALHMGLMPEDLRNAAGAQLAKRILSNDTRMATGFLGTRSLLPALSASGQHDLAVRLLQSRKFPSWGYEIDQGATTIWERWNSYTKENGFGGSQNAAMNSFAHYSFGAVCEWMFSQLAGIDTDGPAYQRIIIRPGPPNPGPESNPPPIDWVRAHYDSIQGRISTSWKRNADRFRLEVTIPPNTTATVYLPARDEAHITEGGTELAQTKGVKFLRMENGRAVLAIESGGYEFLATTKP